MRVLFIIDHAPDYRESFLRELAKKVDLTVLAQPSEADSLNPPQERVGYAYIEEESKSWLGLRFQGGVYDLINKGSWDIVCVALNIRHISRILSFLKLMNNVNWVWWGQVFGRLENPYVIRMKKLLLDKSKGCLVYNEEIKDRVNKISDCCVESFNNTEVRQCEFREGSFSAGRGLKLLFVGRYQERKRLDRIVKLAEQLSFIEVRLVGPGMENLKLLGSRARDRIEIFDRLVGEELNQHFDWSDIVVSPGHVGLLVMNSARHGKGIVIDEKSRHAPEYLLAKQADQIFVDFSDTKAVEACFLEMASKKHSLVELGRNLQKVARQQYTIEHMANKHFSFFNRLLGKS